MSCSLPIERDKCWDANCLNSSQKISNPSWYTTLLTNSNPKGQQPKRPSFIHLKSLPLLPAPNAQTIDPFPKSNTAPKSKNTNIPPPPPSPIHLHIPLHLIPRRQKLINLILPPNLQLPQQQQLLLVRQAPHPLLLRR